MGASDSYHLARRRFLQAGTLALFAGATPAGVPRAFTPEGNEGLQSFGRAKRCILVYLLGGPPQIDMWDMKPDAPAEIRGPFKSIASAVPGMRFCEHLPKLAARADDLAILRSVTFPNNDHPAMIYHSLTGRESRVPLGANTVLPPSRSDDPHLGAVVARFKHRRTDAPGYVAIPPDSRAAAMPASSVTSSPTKIGRRPRNADCCMSLSTASPFEAALNPISTASRAGRSRNRG